MKHKHNRTRALVVIAIALIIGMIIVVNPTTDDIATLFDSNVGLQSNDINAGAFSTTGTLYSLNWLNYLYECEAESELYIRINGVWKLVSRDSDLFRTTVAEASLQQRTTGDIITDFRSDNFITCDYPQPELVQHLKISGDTTISIYSGFTQEKLLRTHSVNILLTTLPDNQRVKVSQFIFSADSVEAELLVSPKGNSYIHVNSVVNGAYVMTFNSGQIFFTTALQENSAPTSGLFYAFTVADNVSPIVEDANTKDSLIVIDDILQTKTNTSIVGKTMDLEKGQQIKIKATMRDFKDTDGLPTVNIIGPGVNVKIVLKAISISNDNDAKFERNFLLPRSGSIGDWSVKLSHVFRNGDSTRTFSVIDTGITTTTDPSTGITTTTTTSGQLINVSTDTTSSVPSTELTTPTTITKMHYIHRYDQVPDCNISTGICKLVQKTVSGIGESKTIQLTSLVDSISFGGQTGVEAILDQVQITTVVSSDNFDTLKKIKRAIASTTTYTANLKYSGGGLFFQPFVLHSPQPNICFGLENESSCPASGGMQLDVITISNNKLEQELTKAGIKPIGQKVTLSVVATGGTFTVIDGANKEHMGSAKGTSYSYDFKFGATPVNTQTSMSSSQTCNSSDPTIACECPDGETLSFSGDKNKLVCIDSDGVETISAPKSNTSNKDSTTITNAGDVIPHCEINSAKEVIATFGNVSVDDPNCEFLYGTPEQIDKSQLDRCITNPDDQQCILELREFCLSTNLSNVDRIELCTIDGVIVGSLSGESSGVIQGDPDEQPSGSGGTQPLVDCEEVFGTQFCAFASNPESFFTGDGTPDSLDGTVIGILVGILFLIIIVAVALKRRRAIRI